MSEPIARKFSASDGYPIHVLDWRAEGPARGHVVVLHGVQSHAGWYHRLGRNLAASGFHAHFPDRRGSGSNTLARGHTPSAQRLVDDLGEFLGEIRAHDPGGPIALAGISWGGKIAVIAAAEFADRVDALALICPGLHPRVGVSARERLAIAWAYLTGRRASRTFEVPLADPALFTDNPEGQVFIAADPLSIRRATAGLLAASTFLDRRVARLPGRVRQPALLMLAGHDRIVDNDRTRAYFERLASTDRKIIDYPDGHHTLEFDPEPGRYARDLAAWLEAALPAPRAMG